MHEERFAGFLQMFLTSLPEVNLMVFLRFVSGAEIMPGSIIVEFNGESNQEQMIPTAHTCATSIHLSRFFLTYESLATNLKNLIANQNLWARFDMILQIMSWNPQIQDRCKMVAL